jgi:hypothetical protein
MHIYILQITWISASLIKRIFMIHLWTLFYVKSVRAMFCPFALEFISAH